MRLLVTGATGFIGSHLVPRLAGSGHEVHVVVRSGAERFAFLGPRQVHEMGLDSPSQLGGLFSRIQPEGVIHLASSTVPGGLQGSFDHHYQHTVRPAIHVASALPPSLRLAVFFGSSIEYGNQVPPFHEEMPPQCSSPYAWGKIAAFYGVREILSERDLPGCWVRPFITFGPGPMHSQLIPSLIRGCLAGDTVPLTAGAQTRDFVFVRDLCGMVERLLAAPSAAAGEVINLASGIPRSIRSVAEQIRALAGAGELAFGALPYRPQEPMAFFGSCEKFEARFGPVNLTPFDAALAETVEAFRR